jgi:uracil-DNA glycosylase
MNTNTTRGQAITITRLINEAKACTMCAAHLPMGPRPVLQASATARILIAGQAPGRKVHESGVPFDDASGERLRQWMGVAPDVFYNDKIVAILPMGFCYPGTGKSGDLPPRRECAPQWRQPLLAAMPRIELTLVIGHYAQDWHLHDKPMHDKQAGKLTDTVKHWREHWPAMLPLPHPSPRNNIWLKANPWFASEVLPVLQGRIKSILAS